MGNFNKPPEDRILTELRELRTLVASLSAAAPKVTIVTEDPDADSGITLWMMTDGRLRGRRTDGTIMQYATTTPGESTSAEPGPTPGYNPTSYEYLQAASWQQAYKDGGSSQYDNPAGRMFYGNNEDGNGEYVSMMGFPSLTDFAPGPEGIFIARVQAFIDNEFTYLAGGATLRIGLHNSSTAPGTFSETVAGVITIPVLSEGGMWVDLPTSIGEAFSAGTAKGLTFHQAESAKTYYGYADSIQLKISYAK